MTRSLQRLISGAAVLLLGLGVHAAPQSATSPVLDNDTSVPATKKHDDAAAAFAVAFPNSDAERIAGIERRVAKVYDTCLKSTVALYYPIPGRRRAAPNAPMVSGGTGVIVSEDGYVLTAGHVIEELGTRFEVQLHDGRRLAAEALGYNSKADYGLLKITEPADLTHARLGDSSQLVRNEAVVMMGFPGGVKLNRPAVLRFGTYLGTRSDGFLRTDCLMMPGDSGGALFDLTGRVIGINSQIAVPEDANFHAPINLAKNDWQRLVDGEVWGAGGSMRRLRYQAAPEASKFSVIPDGRKGLARAMAEAATSWSGSVIEVRSDGADGKRRKVLGIVVGADGLILSKSSEVETDNIEVRFSWADREVAEVVSRDTETDLVLLKVQRGDLTPIHFAPETTMTPGQFVGALGRGGRVMHAGTVSVGERAIPRGQWGMLGIQHDRRTPEVRISAVGPGGPAAQAGVKPGDVLVSIDGEPFETGTDLTRYIRTTDPGQLVFAEIERDGTPMMVEITLGASGRLNETMGRNANSRMAHAGYRVERSERRGRFDAAVRMDLPLKPAECGGPLVNLDGEVVGYTTARIDRPGSLALPNHVVVAALSRLGVTENTIQRPPASDHDAD